MILKNGVFCVVMPEELSGSFSRVTRIGELMKEALSSSETQVLTRATQHNTPEDDILHSQRCENLISYVALTGWTM
jgi:hypothetical protein